MRKPCLLVEYMEYRAWALRMFGPEYTHTSYAVFLDLHADAEEGFWRD